MTSFSEPGLIPDPVIHHHILTGGDSSPFENGSESTGSSGPRKEHLYRGAYSDHGGFMDKPSAFLPRTGSTISTDEPELMDPNTILASMSHSRPPHLYNPHHHHHYHNRRHHPHRRHQPPFHHLPLSQDSDYPGPYASSSALLSQQSGSYYKPGSPASSSETDGSLASSVQRRLRSGPASPASSSIDLSQTTNSSTRSGGGYTYRLPRPHMGNGYGSMYPRQYPTVPEIEPHMMGLPSDATGMPLMGKGYHSPETDPRMIHHPHHLPPAEQTHINPEAAQKVSRRKGSEEKAERDPFSVKLDMVMSVMSAFSMTSKSDADAVKLILALSQSPETSSVMSESHCIEHLIQILHKIQQKGSREHTEIRIKAAEALRNIVKSTSTTKRGKSELAVLNSLERVRNHCERMFHFIYSYRGPQRQIDPMVLESLQKSCSELMATLRKLFKYSGEKELYRPAILKLGGLQAMAEILVVDYHLPLLPNNQKVIGHSPDIIAITITTLINLTYGDPNSKQLLCTFPDFLHALISHMYSSEEAVLSKGAQVLRNLSCKASKEIKDCLLKCSAVEALMAAIDNAEGETTIQHITSALWNISAHSIENRHHICRTRTGIATLVCLLSYNSPSGTTVVVENVGGILRNLSNVISLHEDYRKQFRESGGLAKLVQHLKSKNRTVLSNATGILWNLSARNREDQKLLWELGCVPLLDVLQTSLAKNVAENARAALRNLLAFGQSGNIGALNGKLRRPSSKSTTTLPIVTHLSQSNGMDYEIQSGRRSAPYHSTTNSVYPPMMSVHLSQEKGLLRCKSEAGPRIAQRRVSDEESSGEDYTPKQMSLKFSRVGSAPQPHNEEEWRNYRPERGLEEMPSLKPKSHTPHHANKKQTSKQFRTRGGERGPSVHSLSQSESYEMSSVSELQSVSGASYGMSSGYPADHPTGQAEASAEYDDLEVELDFEDRYGSEDRSQRARTPSSSLRYLSQPDPEAQDHFTSENFLSPLEKLSNTGIVPSPPTPSYLQQAHKQASEETRSNTDSLALDGAILDEQHRASPTRRLSRHSSTGPSQSPAKELSTEL